MSFDDIVTTLDRTEVVAIVTTKAAGDALATPIWSMVLDEVPYVRSAYGEASWWYRHIQAGRPVGFVLGDGSLAERDRAAALELQRELVGTEHVLVGDAVQAAIDEEIRRKYAGQDSSIAEMLTQAARSCTLRIVPLA